MMSASMVRDEVLRVAEHLDTGPRDLHLGLECPLAFAWALGHMLVLRGAVRVYHHDRDKGR
jgi:hypothetical protein